MTSGSSASSTWIEKVMRFERVLCGDVMVREHTQLTQNKKFLLARSWFNASLIFQFICFLRYVSTQVLTNLRPDESAIRNTVGTCANNV